MTRLAQLTLFAVTTLALTLTGCGQQQESTAPAKQDGASKQAEQPAAKTVKLRLGHALDTNHPVHKSIEYFAQQAEKLSNGTLQIIIFPSGKLGGEREMVEQLQLGQLDITKVSTSLVENFIPEMSVYTMPYLFRDNDHKWQVLLGDIGKELLDAGANEQVKLKGLCYLEAGARSFYLRDKPVTSPDDLQGLKIRVQKSQIMVDFIKALGAAPTPISWGELYTALQQGVVDGAENNAPSLFSAKHYEVCPYYSLTEHVAVPDMLLVSQHTWKRLGDTHKNVLQQAARLAVEFQRELWKKEVTRVLEQMKTDMEALGKTFQVNEVDKQPFMAAVQPMYDQLMSNPDKADIAALIKRIRAVGQDEAPAQE